MYNNVDNNNNIHECSGCGMCSAVCPANAIEMSFSEDGYYRPEIKTDKCVNCQRCLSVCYKYDGSWNTDIENEKPIICYSAQNTNKKELMNASSGAVSIELMRTAIDMGYYVVGVAYDYANNCAITKIAKTKNELEEFKGSKYFQSKTQEAYKSIVNDRTNQKYAIFGTPCQIYAFSRLVEKIGQQDKFLLIDIFCHGCPSFLLWKKYCKEKMDDNDVLSFEKIVFRSKQYGWHEFAFDFTVNGRTFFSNKINDPFYELFFGMDIMNLACYDCIPRSSTQKCDIRIGDFWGWQFDKDTEGVSAVVIQTKKGEDFFDKTKDKFEVHNYTFESIIKAQSYGKRHEYNSKRRNETLELLKSDTPIRRIQRIYKKSQGIKYNLKTCTKNILKLLPGNIYCLLKRVKNRV